MAKRKFYSAQERYNLVMECRKSGLSDCAWCKERGIPQSTFYNWVVFLRKKGIAEIDTVRPNPDAIIPQIQEVVKLDVIPDYEPVDVSVPKTHNEMASALTSEAAMAPVIEITLKSTTIKFSNDVRPELMKVTLQFLGGTLC